MSTDPVARRLRVAERAAAAYAAHPDVAAVLVAGSVARGLADERSDVELDVYWSRPPREDERAAAVEGAGWARVYAEVDEHEWADGYVVDGVKVDTSGFTTATIDRYLDAALEEADTEPELQVRITALLHGRTLSGDDVVDAWRARCDPYPDALAAAMVDKGLGALRPRERLEMLAARDDVLLLHSDLVDSVQALLDVLFGLGRVYVPHPFHKWLTWEASLLPHAPDRLVERVRALLVAPPAEAVAGCVSLVEDTFALVARHRPAHDVSGARADFAFRRAD